MKYFISLAAVLSLVLGDPGFVQLPLSVEKKNVSSTHDVAGVHPRSVNDKLQNGVTQYFVDIALGTPGQTQHVSIDTGSSDLWVYGPQSPGAPQVYDPSQSSTARFVDNGFNIHYVDGTGAVGAYYTDDSSLGGANVNFQFAVANQAGSGYGVFGIASINDEADVDGRYPNYPVALKQNGLIESTAYSLYLDDVDASSGSLLFGGVDSSKYSGQLYSVPILSSNSFTVEVEVGGYKINAVLDAGTSFTYLPDDFANALGQKYHGRWDNLQGVYFVDRVYNDSITYNFSGAEVTVPPSELFIYYNGGIALTIAPASAASGNYLLGDSFLRSAYVVYDLDNNQIAIAQADYNGSGSIQAITSSGIPGSSPAPDL